jgi:hypothetical protein
MELAYGKGMGWFYSLGRGSWDASLLGCQMVMLLFIFGWTMFTMMPFFIWLNYKGWLRADSLEELVGLDISYHGGRDLKDGGVKKEFVEAYKRHKGQIRERRGSRLPSSTHGSEVARSHNSAQDPENDQEAAANEAFADTP